jgi:hypothetical protein
LTRKLLIALIAISLTLSVFTVFPAPAEAAVTIGLSAAIGTSGTVITVTGTTNTPAAFGTNGTVWMDTVVVNGAYDVGEPYVTFVTSPLGAYSVSFTIPAVLPSSYNFYTIIPLDAPPLSPAAPFTVSMLSPRTGGPGTVVTLSGGGFAASGLFGIIWFDANGDGAYNTGETGVLVTTTTGGALPSGLTIVAPNLVAGGYNVLADIPFGGAVEATSLFTYPTKAFTLTVATGIPGDTLSITAAVGLWASTLHRAYFDSNGNSSWDTGETFVDFTTTATGTLAATLTMTVPEVAFGTYNIRVDVSPFTSPAEASAVFNVILGIVLSPTTGVTGIAATITVRGGGFTASSPGLVWFDLNGDNLFTAGEPSVSVLSSAVGSFTTTLTLTLPAIGVYPIQADLPVGGAVEAFANFSVVAALPAITLAPTTGGPGTVISVTGANFGASITGVLFFDTNMDGAYTVGEPIAVVTTTAGGFITATPLTAPAPLAAGTYAVRADIPFGGAIEASATFTVPALTATRAPTSGGPGTVVTITGSGFTAITGGVIYFDTDGNGAFTAGEPLTAVVTDTAGVIPAGTTITVPTTVAAGAYNIIVDIPFGGAVEATLGFTVLAPTLVVSPLQGVPGETLTITGVGYTVGTLYTVYFDTNGNDAWDAGETSVAAGISAAGALTATLTVPVVTPGAYFVRSDLTAALTAPSVASALFVRPTPIVTLNPTSGGPATIVTIMGLGFPTTALHTIYFDINGDSVWQVIEPFATVIPVLPLGSFLVTLVIPDVTPGSYSIRIDATPLIAPADASVTFTIPVPPTVTASVSPESIVRGDSATLTWTSTNAATLTIFPGIGAAPLSGSIVVNPTVSTTYILTVVGAGGTATASVTLTVTAPPPPPPAPLPTVTASVSPASIVRGANATLTWSTTDATVVSIFPVIGAVPTAGSLVVSPTVTTVYTITATGPGGTVNFNVTLTVTEPPPPPPAPRVVELRIGSTYYKVDGVTLIMDVEPYIEFGRTFVPVRFVVTGLGGTVEWDGETRTVVIWFTKPVLHIRLVIGEPVAVVGTTIVPIDEDPSVVPVIKGGRTFVPLRFLLDRITGSSIEWVPPDVVIMRLPR